MRRARRRVFGPAVALVAIGITAGLASPDTLAAMPTPSANAALFGVRPLQQGRTTLPGGHFNYALGPGEHIADAVVIENFANHTIVFTVYAADLLSASGGGVAPAQPGAVLREAGSWIAIVVSQCHHRRPRGVH